MSDPRITGPASVDVERTIIRTVLSAEGEDAGRLLAVLADRCAPPLHRWFTDRDCQLIALALDVAVRGETGADLMSVYGTLSGIGLDDGAATISGRGPCRHRPSLDLDDSVAKALGGLGMIAGWDNIYPSPSGQAANVAILRDLAERRQVIEALRVAAQDLAKRTDPSRTCAHAVAGLVDRLAPFAAGGGREDRTVGDALGQALADGDALRQRRDRGEIAAATWGLPSLDRAVPLRPGSMYVLTAPPGCGKTSLALMAAAATAGIAHAGAVLMVSLEMTGGDLATILAGRHLGIGAGTIRDGLLDAESAADVEALAATWRAAGSLLIRDASTGSACTAAAVASWARMRQVAAGGRLALVVVDYLGLLESTDPRQTEYARLSDATRTIKRMAMALDVPVLLLAQLNRQGTTSLRDRGGRATVAPEPRLADLRGSGSIEQDADAVVALHRPSMDPGSRVPIRALILKHRRGALGTVDLWFAGARQEFSEANGDASRGERLRSASVAAEDAFNEPDHEAAPPLPGPQHTKV